jgi:rod shape-determining protein MreC
VQVLRSGVRTIALGTGRSTALDLPYVAQNHDVKVGDLLVTSGLGRVFPYGLPVGRVTKVERDPAEPLASIQAEPIAKIDSEREVLFIWARAGHSAAPASDAELVIETPKPAAKPKPAARPAPKPAAPAATPAPAADPATTPSPATTPDPATTPAPETIPPAETPGAAT